jgi:integrase
MASISKRGNSWQYTVSRYTNKKYDPIRKGGFKSEKEAKLAAAEVEVDLSKGVQASFKSDVFVDYFKEWVKDYKSTRAKATQDRYETTLNTINKEFGATYLQDINKRQYQRFLNVFGESHTKGSLRKLNTHIRACVREAVDEGRLRVDFTRGVELNSKIKEKTEAEKHLNYMEAKQLLKELAKHIVRSPLYLLLILALQSGMRYSELLGLKRSDFNIKKKTIKVERSMDYKKGTGLGPLKTENAYRILDMDEWTMNLFNKYFEDNPPNIQGLVFFNPHSKSHTFSNERANTVLKEALARLGIEHITVHGLRHTHISVLLYLGVNVLYVSKRAGHADTNITMSTYAHVLEELQETEVEKTRDFMKAMGQ